MQIIKYITFYESAFHAKKYCAKVSLWQQGPVIVLPLPPPLPPDSNIEGTYSCRNKSRRSVRAPLMLQLGCPVVTTF